MSAMVLQIDQQQHQQQDRYGTKTLSVALGVEQDQVLTKFSECGISVVNKPTNNHNNNSNSKKKEVKIIQTPTNISSTTDKNPASTSNKSLGQMIQPPKNNVNSPSGTQRNGRVDPTDDENNDMDSLDETLPTNFSDNMSCSMMEDENSSSPIRNVSSVTTIDDSQNIPSSNSSNTMSTPTRTGQRPPKKSLADMVMLRVAQNSSSDNDNEDIYTPRTLGDALGMYGDQPRRATMAEIVFRRMQQKRKEELKEQQRQLAAKSIFGALGLVPPAPKEKKVDAPPPVQTINQVPKEQEIQQEEEKKEEEIVVPPSQVLAEALGLDSEQSMLDTPEKKEAFADALIAKLVNGIGNQDELFDMTLGQALCLRTQHEEDEEDEEDDDEDDDDEEEEEEEITPTVPIPTRPRPQLPSNSLAAALGLSQLALDAIQDNDADTDKLSKNVSPDSATAKTTAKTTTKKKANANKSKNKKPKKSNPAPQKKDVDVESATPSTELSNGGEQEKTVAALPSDEKATEKPAISSRSIPAVPAREMISLAQALGVGAVDDPYIQEQQEERKVSTKGGKSLMDAVMAHAQKKNLLAQDRDPTVPMTLSGALGFNGSNTQRSLTKSEALLESGSGLSDSHFQALSVALRLQAEDKRSLEGETIVDKAPEGTGRELANQGEDPADLLVMATEVGIALTMITWIVLQKDWMVLKPIDFGLTSLLKSLFIGNHRNK